MRQKLYIFLFAIFVLPVTVLLSLIYNLSDNGMSVYHNDLITQAFALFATLFFISLIITFLNANSIQNPLAKMKSLSKEISNGNYNTHIALDSNDEMGILTDGMNQMAACITSEGGVINKFIGDAIMAVFSAPVALNDHADAAIRAGMAMLNVQNKLKHELETNEPSLQSRIGIHTGQVLAGNIGASNRMEYTVIGDAVNTASRLESLCKKLNCDLLTSNDTVLQLADRSMLRSLGRVKVKGKSELIKVYGII